MKCVLIYKKMTLNNKNILVFGGDSFLWNEMMPFYLESKANLFWINTQENLKSSVFNIEKLAFDSIVSVNSYEIFFNDNINFIPNLDGVVFSLSTGDLRPLPMTKPAQMHHLYELNCVAFVELIRILNKKKKINDGASLLAFSSISSLMGLKTKLAYSASKAALNSVILNLSVELGLRKIRVNGVLKGALTTDLNHEHVKNMFNLGSDKSRNQILGMSTPKELAFLSIFLLSDQVKTMTGTLIKLDGGYSLW